MRRATLLLAALLLAGCASHRHASTAVHRDVDHAYTQRQDSLLRALLQRDSVYVLDRGDTVTRYVERLRYQLQVRTDTLYRSVVRRDTVYAEHADTVTVEVPVEVPMRWYDRGFAWLGRLSALLLLVLALRGWRRKP